MLFGERFRRRRIHLQRIDRSTVLPYPEIKMRACGTTGRAHITYDFSLTDTLARLESLGIFREMEIGSGIYRIVPDSHSVAAGTFIFHTCHHTVSYGHDRSSLRSSIVNSRVRLDTAGHRMLSRI